MRARALQAPAAGRAFVFPVPRNGLAHWIERLMRFGYVTRGVLYVIPGVVALRVALGSRSAEMSPAAAIQSIGHQPFGRILLIAVAIGLLGYTLWGFSRAFLDALDKGHSAHGLAQRFGYVTSTIAYAGLLILTLHLLARSETRPPGSAWPGRLMDLPLGTWILGGIGVGWIIGAGLTQIASGWRRTYVQDFDAARMSVRERRWASVLGRIGLIARGVVFAVIGVLLVTSAVRASKPEGPTMNDALLEITRPPFGRVFLTAAAIGLIAFGAFSALCARWVRVRFGHAQVANRFNAIDPR